MIKHIPARPASQSDTPASLARDTHAAFVRCRETNRTVQQVRLDAMKCHNRRRFDRDAFMAAVWSGLAKN